MNAVWCFINQRKINFNRQKSFVDNSDIRPCPSNADLIEQLIYVANRIRTSFNALMATSTAKNWMWEAIEKECERFLSRYFWRCETRFMSPSHCQYPKKLKAFSVLEGFNEIEIKTRKRKRIFPKQYRQLWTDFVCVVIFIATTSVACGKYVVM